MTVARWVLHGILAEDAVSTGMPSISAFLQQTDMQIRRLRASGLLGIASRLGRASRDPRATQHAALLHHRLITAVSLQDDILPFRFGQGFTSLSAVASMISKSSHEWRHALSEIAGRQEITCRISIPSPARNDTADRRSAVGSSYLATQLQARRAARDGAARLELIAHSLADVVRGIGSEAVKFQRAPRGRPTTLAIDALVNRGDAHATLSALEGESARLAEEGFALQVDGPWAPYSFVDGGGQHLA